ncbi:hypothetical protein GH714_014288 [Hevea brasiliensis]|uniref:RecA family profile 1 domain-containing protein n=1 Tax=Hevea brasiliensis TaxID=3981 RepID=A0A6A6MVG9_HEVBR|nr:hypothetical protein GH714_014288 [Hevea brasiliensis]
MHPRLPHPGPLSQRRCPMQFNHRNCCRKRLRQDATLPATLPLRSTPSLPRRPLCFRSLLPHRIFFSVSPPQPTVPLFPIFIPSSFISDAVNSSKNGNCNPCDNIYVQSVHSADQLLDMMPKIESFIGNSKTHFPVRLIVIDSVAALFRSEFGNTTSDLWRRSSLLFKISGKLKVLAKRYNLAVVVTNQVVDFVGSGEGVNGVRIGNLGSLCSSGRRVCPALGLAWASCVNSRLFLARDENGLVDGDESSFPYWQTTRRLHIIFAPHLPYSSCELVIRREGVFGIDR